MERRGICGDTAKRESMKRKNGVLLVAAAMAMVLVVDGRAAASDGKPDSKIGLAVMAGGGVTDFTQGAARDQTAVGGSWDVRALIATRTWIGFEVSYIGGANPIKALGLSGNSKLVRNGVETAVRVQLPLYHRITLLEPYILGGVGWNTYRVTYVNSYSASVTNDGDNTVAVPFGVGFMAGYKGFVVDVRSTIRPTFRQSILGGQSATGLTNWDSGAMIGFEF
jgi:hypothetical protein